MRKSIERLVDIVGQATCWLALVIVVLMACNVVLRYTLSFGSVWAQELEWHLLATIILFGSFLIYGIVDRIAVKRRGDEGAAKANPNVLGDLLSIAVGIALYLLLIYAVLTVLTVKESKPPLAEGLNGYARCREGQRGWTYTSVEALDKRIAASDDPPPAGVVCPSCLALWGEQIVIDEELDEALARGYRVAGPASLPEHLERTG